MDRVIRYASTDPQTVVPKGDDRLIIWRQGDKVFVADHEFTLVGMHDRFLIEVLTTFPTPKVKVTHERTGRVDKRVLEHEGSEGVYVFLPDHTTFVPQAPFERDALRRDLALMGVDPLSIVRLGRNREWNTGRNSGAYLRCVTDGETRTGRKNLVIVGNATWAVLYDPGHPRTPYRVAVWDDCDRSNLKWLLTLLYAATSDEEARAQYEKREVKPGYDESLVEAMWTSSEGVVTAWLKNHVKVNGQFDAAWALSLFDWEILVDGRKVNLGRLDHPLKPLLERFGRRPLRSMLKGQTAIWLDNYLHLRVQRDPEGAIAKIAAFIAENYRYNLVLTPRGPRAFVCRDPSATLQQEQWPPLEKMPELVALAGLPNTPFEPSAVLRQVTEVLASRSGVPIQPAFEVLRVGRLNPIKDPQSEGGEVWATDLTMADHPVYADLREEFVVLPIEPCPPVEILSQLVDLTSSNPAQRTAASFLSYRNGWRWKLAGSLDGMPVYPMSDAHYLLLSGHDGSVVPGSNLLGQLGGTADQQVMMLRLRRGETRHRILVFELTRPYVSPLETRIILAAGLSIHLPSVKQRNIVLRPYDDGYVYKAVGTGCWTREKLPDSLIAP